MRVAAVVTDHDTVEVAIRSAETRFAADHFRARMRVPDAVNDHPVPDGPPDQIAPGLPAVPLVPDRDLYGDTLFQGPLFQRLRRYHQAAARHVDAEVAVLDEAGWFADFLPGELLLGDPGMRDALMHGTQVCVPDATLLPAGIERVYPGGHKLVNAGEVRYCATERSRDGDTYVYDIAVRTGTGEIVERWEGLRLQAVRKKDGRGPWVIPLLGAYLERTLGDLLIVPVTIVVEPDSPERRGDRRDQTAVAARSRPRRPDRATSPTGRSAGNRWRASHFGSTWCGPHPRVVADGPVGCDVEHVAERPLSEWQGLLGTHASLAELVAAELRESGDAAGRGSGQPSSACRRRACRPPRPCSRCVRHRETGGPFSPPAHCGSRHSSLPCGTDLKPVVFAVLVEGQG